jgi:hypothetical protein
MSLRNFEVISCLFYISNIDLMFVDMEDFPKRDFAKLSYNMIMFSKASFKFHGVKFSYIACVYLLA